MQALGDVAEKYLENPEKNLQYLENNLKTPLSGGMQALGDVAENNLKNLE